MTRLDLLRLVIGRARVNGFEFRRWYTTRLGLPWISPEAALALLDAQRRYYALLFSHEFACTFWKAGSEITFEVPARSVKQHMPDGSLRSVERKAYMRRSIRRDAWRYHLREMALAEEPLRYLRKYLNVEDQLDPEPEVTPRLPKRKRSAVKPAEAAESASPALRHRKRQAAGMRPLSADKPAFLKRPYGIAAPARTLVRESDIVDTAASHAPAAHILEL